ncbi:unnamed protein product, partial [Oppiella nova]
MKSKSSSLSRKSHSLCRLCCVDKLWMTAIRNMGLIVIYYLFSIGITFYQKWFIKKFHYPLSVVTCHMIVKLMIAYFLRLTYKSITGIYDTIYCVSTNTDPYD